MFRINTRHDTDDHGRNGYLATCYLWDREIYSAFSLDEADAIEMVQNHISSHMAKLLR